MNNNFLNFIQKDIEAKKVLISTMPVKTKANIKKYNQKVEEIKEKYEAYMKSVKTYVDYRNKTFSIKNIDKNLQQFSDSVVNLQHVKFVLNPLNTYFEKMGFDNLIYEISNYCDFKFDSLHNIINEFLNKFELAGIKLQSDDFNYTCYVNEYMNAFLNARNKNDNYDDVFKIFEEIYWVNPDIIQHIELNFRKLIKEHEKKFKNYVSQLQNEIMSINKIKNYEVCLNKLKSAYNNLSFAEEENIIDIINLAKTGVIDINHYLNDNKVRNETYSSLAIDTLNFDDKEAMVDFYDNLKKLKVNIEEYSNYKQFIPLIDDFKEKFKKEVGNKDNKISNNEIKNIEKEIKNEEAKLDKINRKIFTGKIEFLKVKNNEEVKQLKINSVNIAKNLYLLYNKYDHEFFKNKVLSILSNTFTISEVLNLYYSFDYFKKLAIKKVFDINDYDELIKTSDNFDLFSMNPTNVIMDGVSLFDENNIIKVIMNKYRLNNINLNEEDLDTDDLDSLLNKINMLLRIDKIEKSETSIDKIWFMVQVERINSKTV